MSSRPSHCCNGHHPGVANDLKGRQRVPKICQDLFIALVPEMIHNDSGTSELCSTRVPGADVLKFGRRERPCWVG